MIKERVDSMLADKIRALLFLLRGIDSRNCLVS